MKIFKMLYSNPLTVNEIIVALQVEGILINKETLAKYFKTFKEAGCVIKKNRGKYCLASIPFTLNLSDEDYYYLAVFVNLGLKLYDKNMHQDLISAIKKILSLADECGYEKYAQNLGECVKITPEPFIFKEKISRLIKYGYENSKVKVLYKDKKITVSHISFKYCDNAVYVHAFNEDTKKYELLLLSAINEIYSTPEISNKSAFAPYTVFEIMGRLAKTYTLYEGERVIKIKEDSIVVSNNYEDKAELYKRLLRYGTLCKIISTQDDIERFKQMLNKMEKALLASVVS